MFRGFRVATAASGVEAITVVGGADRPALILMDLEMQGMSGAGALQEFAGNPALANVPILAFAAHAMVAERDLAIREGFGAVIPCHRMAVATSNSARRAPGGTLRWIVRRLTVFDFKGLHPAV